jgi:hypothetical protein
MSNEPAGTEHAAFSAEEIAAHREHDHLAAVFVDRAHATEAVDALRELGLGSDHLGVAVRGEDPVVFEHDEDAELVHDTEVGAAAGVSIGALAGLGLAALAVPGIGTIGAGGILALAGASALWGGLLGAYFGATAAESGWIAHADIDYTALDEREVLVVVCSHGHPDAIRDVMERHGGRWHLVEAGRL